MGCDIVFKINGELRDGLSEDGRSINRLVIQDSGIVSNEKFKEFGNGEATLLNVVKQLLLDKNIKIKQDLVNIINGLKDTSSRKVTPSQIQQNGVIGNTKFTNLRIKYAGMVEFPNTNYNPDILLVDSLDLKGVNSKDMIYRVGEDGNIVYVVSNTKGSIQRLANHIITRELILKSKFEENSTLSKLLPKLAEAGKKFDSVQDLLLDFIMNDSEYRGILKENGLYGLLRETIKSIQNPTRSQIYTEQIDIDVDNKTSPVRGTKEHSISIKEFIELAKVYAPEILEGITQTQLKNNPNLMEQVFNKFNEKLVDLTCRFRHIKGDKIYLKKKQFPTVNDIYGYTYSTVNDNFKYVKTYRGFNIYQNVTNGTYMFSQDVITPYTRVSKYNSSEEIERAIDVRYDSGQYNFGTNFDASWRILPAYERVNSLWVNKYYSPGSVVKILDIALDRNTILDPAEAALLGIKGRRKSTEEQKTQRELIESKKRQQQEQSLNRFYEMFESQLTEEQMTQLRKVANDIESAGIFVYLVNQRIGIRSRRDLKQRDSQIFSEILNTIKEAKDKQKYKYFFVQDTGGGKGMRKLSIIPLGSTQVKMSEKYDRPEPIIGLITEVAEVFKQKFGMEVEILNQNEINEILQGEGDANVKAFIRDGKIYINGSTATSADVVHEYTHLFLGALKAQNFDMYQNLLNKVVSSDKADFKKKELRKLYPNLAQTDFNEEVFVALFSEFLAGKSSSDMLKEVESATNQVMKSIFNLATDEDFNSIYKGGFDKIFERFSKELRGWKGDSGIEFAKGTVYRKASKWISDQIRDEKIIEQGC